MGALVVLPALTAITLAERCRHRPPRPASAVPLLGLALLTLVI